MEQKILKYSTATIVSLLCLAFSLPLHAQQQRPNARPSTKEKAKEEIKVDTIPFYNGTYVGVDLFGLGSKLLGGDFLSSEVNVRVNLKRKFIPTAEISILLHNRNFSYLFQQAKISTKNQEKKKITLFINRASNSYMDVPKENPTMTIVSNRRIQFLPTPLYRYQNHTDLSRPRNTHLPPQEKHRY